MTHLVIWSSLRAGSHMLRSMLGADPRVYDADEFMDKLGRLRTYLDAATKAHPDAVIVSNPKWGRGVHPIAARARVLADVGARVILLHRRDLLAQQASFQLALKNKSFIGVAPAGARITMNPEAAGLRMFQHALELEKLRLTLAGMPHVELAYEDISRASVVAALASLGLDLEVAEPTTRKSAPPRLADFVTNLSELI